MLRVKVVPELMTHSPMLRSYLIVDRPGGEGVIRLANERVDLAEVLLVELSWVQRQVAHVGSQHQEGERDERQRTRHLRTKHKL